LLLFFRKEDSSFLKERSKELLLLWHSLPAPLALQGVSNDFLVFFKKEPFPSAV
jgi:hypothetical protein